MAPDVSIILLVYNQEAYIERALESVINQSYDNTEIIIADDCSSDRSYSIIDGYLRQRAISPKVISYKNEKNLGLIDNLYKALKLSVGPLIVLAAGDDESTFDRVDKIRKKWIQRGKGNCFIYSNYEIINLNGRSIKKASGGPLLTTNPRFMLSLWGEHAMGATIAFTRDVFEKYGKIDAECLCEDVPFAWRAAMSGNIYYINESLVRWRFGSGYSGTIQRKTIEQESFQIQRELNKMYSLSKQAVADSRTSGNKFTNCAELFYENVSRAQRSDSKIAMTKCLWMIFTGKLTVGYLIISVRKSMNQYEFGSRARRWRTILLYAIKLGCIICGGQLRNHILYRTSLLFKS